MAADSQATEDSGGVRFDVQKVFPLTPRSLCAASGMSGLILDARNAFEEAADMLSQSPDPGQSLSALVGPVLHSHYSRYLNVPGMPLGSPATAFLACGLRDGGVSWITEIDPHNVVTSYTERGFHAIGSGAGFAQMANGLLAHFNTAELSLTYGKLVAFRTVNAVIKVSAFGVGEPVQMWIVDESGCHELDSDELREIEAQVGGWQDEERATLLRFIGGSADEIAEPMPGESGQT